MSIALDIGIPLLAFMAGCAFSKICMHFKRNPRVRVIKRLFPSLAIARQAYNEVSAHIDKEPQNYKLLSLEVKQEKKMQAYALICKYEALSEGVFTF